MQCPDCTGPMWDNREGKKNPKSPDFKCKNKQCDKAVWLKPKASGANGGNGGGVQTSGAAQGGGAQVRARPPLTPLYHKCLEDSKLVVTRVLGDKATVDAIMSGAATLFIAASRDGTPLRSPPKPKPAPPPPEETEEDFPSALYEEDERAIPF